MSWAVRDTSASDTVLVTTGREPLDCMGAGKDVLVIRGQQPSIRSASYGLSMVGWLAIGGSVVRRLRAGVVEVVQWSS